MAKKASRIIEELHYRKNNKGELGVGG